MMQDPSIFPSITPLLPEHERLKCPRCDSNNTKFCYYNNYNLTQPRHFCKNCRRYWTKGGALRNIPVGGGTRKNAKRSPRLISSSSSSSEVVGKSGPPSSSMSGPSPASEASVKVADGGSFSYLAAEDMNSHVSKKISRGNLLGIEGNGEFSGGWPGFKVI